jgi:dephospho-CoA kinase
MDIALDRLVNLRGMPREDAEARIAAQIDRQTRLDGADLVIDNSGDELHLAEEVDRVWGELEKLRSRLPG